MEALYLMLSEFYEMTLINILLLLHDERAFGDYFYQ